MPYSRPGVPRSPQWPALRAVILKEHPKCAICGGTSNLEVHHILPYHLFPSFELAPSNLIPLCEAAGHNCHLEDGHLGNWFDYNPAIVAQATAATGYNPDAVAVAPPA